MSFTPLNKREETEHEIEKHIKEVEFENALKQYQEALKLHYHGDRNQAANAYEALLNSDVLKDVLEKGTVSSEGIADNMPANGSKHRSNITVLPYLVFKNHGNLLLENLKSDYKALDDTEVINILKQVLMEYATGLSYDNDDRVLWQRVARISQVLDLQRANRYALEVQLEPMYETHVVAAPSLFWDSNFSDSDQVLRSSWSNVIDSIRDNYTMQKYAQITNIEIDEQSHQSTLDWLPTRISLVGPAHSIPTTIQMLNITPTACTWYAMSRAIIEKLRISHHTQNQHPVHFNIDLPDWSIQRDSLTDHDDDIDDSLESDALSIDEQKATVDQSDVKMEPQGTKHCMFGKASPLRTLDLDDCDRTPVEGTYISIIETRTASCDMIETKEQVALSARNLEEEDDRNRCTEKDNPRSSLPDTSMDSSEENENVYQGNISSDEDESSEIYGEGHQTDVPEHLQVGVDLDDVNSGSETQGQDSDVNDEEDVDDNANEDELEDEDEDGNREDLDPESGDDDNYETISNDDLGEVEYTFDHTIPDPMGDEVLEDHALHPNEGFDAEQLGRDDSSASPAMSDVSDTNVLLLDDTRISEEGLQKTQNTQSRNLSPSDAAQETPSLAASAQKRTARYSEIDDEEASLRASKRVRQREHQTAETEANVFHNTLRQLFHPLGIVLQDLFDLPPDALEYYPSHATPNVYQDLKLLLYKDWSDERADAARKAKNSAKINSVVAKTMVLEYPALPYPKKDLTCDAHELDNFANRIEHGLSYFRNVIAELLASILGRSSSGTTSPYLRATWTQNFRSIILRLIYMEESMLIDHVCIAMLDTTADHTLLVLMWAEAIFELCLDEFILSEKERVLKAMTFQERSEELDRVRRWRLQVHRLLTAMPIGSENIVIYLRFTWASVVLEQATGAPVESVLQSYVQLRTEMSSLEEFKDLQIPNCQCMHMISMAALDLEVSKFSTMDFFNAVFESDTDGDHTAVMEALQPILIGGSLEEDFHRQRIQEYISRSPVEFQFLLWNLLTEAASADGCSSDALYCYVQSVHLTIATLQSDKYHASSVSIRQIELLSSLDRISALLKGAYALTEANAECMIDWPVSRCIWVLQVLFDYLTILQVFVYYEDIVAEDESYARGTFRYIRFRDHLRQDLLRLWVLIYKVYKHYLNSDVASGEYTGQNLATLINLVHDELGTREYCHLLDDALLALFESELFILDRVETETDLVQIFHCRYGLSYQIGNFVPWEHHTKPESPSVPNALRMLPFVLTFVQEKSSGVWLPKNDVRSVLSRLEEVIWPVVKEHQAIARNNVMLDRYLSRDLEPRDLQNSLRGILDLECINVVRPRTYNERAWGAVSILNLVLGRIHLSVYRNRNKNNSKGAQDLQEALKFYIHDLEITPRRVESWHALGLINGALADIELGYDADRLWSHRETIGRLQRTTLLCYMMATSLSVQNHRRCEVDLIKTDKSFFDLLFDFGQALYNAAREPLAMKCFERHVTRYHEKGDGRVELVSIPHITLKAVLQTTSACLASAAERCNEQWRCLVLLGKVREKLQVKPIHSLDAYSRALALAPAQSLGEQGPLLDPHYRLVSSVYKFLVGDKIDSESAFAYLQQTTFAENHVSKCRPTEKQSVVELCEAILQSICNADKKHWHHRPVHRLAVIAQNSAQILTNANDEAPELVAQRRLEALFTAKGSGGNLLSIWKPEFERPGRHYYYANKYTNYYVDLLLLRKDLEGIKVFMRRLRKATSSVLNHRGIWNKICSNYFSLSNSTNEIPQLDSSSIIDVVDSNDFNTIAAKLEAEAAADFYQPVALRLLRDFYEVRKLNGSLYEPNKIDDELVNLYLILYNETKAALETAQKSLQKEENQGPSSLDDSSKTISNNLESLGNDQDDKKISESTNLDPSPQITTTSAPRGRGRVKETKNTQVSRRDILARCFTLCKPRPLTSERTRDRESSGRTRGHSFIEKFAEPDDNLKDPMQAAKDSTLVVDVAPDHEPGQEVVADLVSSANVTSSAELQAKNDTGELEDYIQESDDVYYDAPEVDERLEETRDGPDSVMGPDDTGQQENTPMDHTLTQPDHAPVFQDMQE